jgi:hypothetical protein
MGNKHTCGIVVPASCSPWTGGALMSADISSICNPSTEEVISELDLAVKYLQESLDITKINAGGYSPLSATQWHQIATVLFNELYATKALVTALTLKLSQLNIGNISLPVSLGCLAGQCSTSPATILQLFDMLISKVCQHDARLNELDPSTAVNGNLLYQPS